jgi:Flp pilus assembly secretin CpaC
MSAGFMLALGAYTGAFATESIAVQLDQAKLVRLPNQVATIVVGNPLIADVSLQPGGIMVVTGKGFGTTNVIIMDRNGSIISEQSVQVAGASDQMVTVYRGIERETLSCAPVCQRRAMLGDSTNYFDTAMKQMEARTAQASGKGESQQQSKSQGNGK